MDDQSSLTEIWFTGIEYASSSIGFIWRTHFQGFSVGGWIDCHYILLKHPEVFQRI